MDNSENEDKKLIADVSSKSKGLTSNLILAATSVVFGSSFQFGYNTAVLNAPEVIIEQFVNETYEDRNGMYLSKSNMTWLWALIVSIFAVGGMFGSLAAGYFAERFGCKRSLLCNNVLSLVAIVFMAITKVTSKYEFLIIGRFVIGFSSGMNTGLAPLYLTEIAPLHLRGVLGTLHQMGIVISLLLAQVLGLSQVLGTSDLWPILLSVPILFVFFQLLTLPCCPETPTFLLKYDRVDDCKLSLSWFRGTSDVEAEFNDISTQQQATMAEPKVDLKTIFTAVHLRRPLLIAVIMQCSQQLSGINAVLYYSTSIFTAAGVAADKSAFITVGVGCTNIVMVCVSLALIERVGRRTLHLTGLGGMFFSAVLLVFTLNLSYLASKLSVVSVIAIFVFVIFFQVGPSSIPWFITAELFKDNARSMAISIAGLVNWFCNFAIGLGYPPIANVIHGYTFIIFAVLLALCWLFTYFKVPETKGKSINEISQHFMD